MKLVSAFLSLIVLGACGRIPRDPDRTLDRVRATHKLNVGIASARISPEAARLVAALAQQNHAQVALRAESLEPLIVDLNAGRVDLVVADMSRHTPWKTLVAPGPVLATRGRKDDRIETRALMKNGENAWIVAVERASRRIVPGS